MERPVRQHLQQIAAGWAVFWHYTALGRYGEQLQHLFGLFPREHVLVLRYRALIRERDRAPGPGRYGTAPSPRRCGQAAR
ncbi:MAG TPA: hypothetical protein VIK57_03470 [Streptosporangiaceae bacterium]